MRQRLRAAVPIVLALLLLPGGRTRGEATQNRSGRVELMIIATTDPKIGNLGPTISGIKGMIRKGVDAANKVGAKDEIKPGQPGYVQYSEFPSPVMLDASVDVEKLSKRIGELNVDPETTLIVYYIGHGIWDKEAARVKGDPKNHLLVLESLDPKGIRHKIRRADLLARLEGRRARTTILITDTCAYVSPTFVEGIARFGAEFPLFESLILQAKGVYDLTSSSYGEISWVNATQGPLFSNTFLSLVSDRERDQSLGWEEFYRILWKKARDNYAGFRQSSLAARPADPDYVDPVAKVIYDLLEKQKTQSPVLLIDHKPIDPEPK